MDDGVQRIGYRVRGNGIGSAAQPSMSKLEFGLQNGTVNSLGRKTGGTNTAKGSDFAHKKLLADENEVKAPSKVEGLKIAMESARVRLKLSQADLGKLVNVSGNMIAQIESGKAIGAQLPPNLMVQIQSKLGVKVTGSKVEDYGRRLVNNKMMTPAEQKKVEALEAIERAKETGADKPKVRASFQPPADFGADKTNVEIADSPVETGAAAETDGVDDALVNGVEKIAVKKAAEDEDDGDY